jgi:hypothetical protein
MLVNNEAERICKQAVVDKFRLVPRVIGTAEEKQ